LISVASSLQGVVLIKVSQMLGDPNGKIFPPGRWQMRFWPEFSGAWPAELDQISYRYFASHPVRRGRGDDPEQTGGKKEVFGLEPEKCW
jgi:hypothetical protein